MTDIKLKTFDGNFDLSLNADGNDMELDEGLYTAVLVSLFVDRRVPEGYEGRLGGWWADALDNTRYGSRLWTLLREKSSTLTLRVIESAIKEALQWMIDTQVAQRVEVSARYVDLFTAQVDVKIFNKDNKTYRFFWNTERNSITE